MKISYNRPYNWRWTKVVIAVMLNHKLAEQSDLATATNPKNGAIRARETDCFFFRWPPSPLSEPLRKGSEDSTGRLNITALSVASMIDVVAQAVLCLHMFSFFETVLQARGHAPKRMKIGLADARFGEAMV